MLVAISGLLVAVRYVQKTVTESLERMNTIVVVTKGLLQAKEAILLTVPL